MNLRDALLVALNKLPGTRQFHLHALVSAPRRHSDLYPFAHPRPKTHLQDILILLSEQATPDAPRLFVSAIEASLYAVPTTSCAILYVSKVDSTGQGLFPPPTSTLVRSFLGYYADPKTRPIAADHLWIQLFARAQTQYLFPNSAEYPGKRPLSDVKLCAWWKRTLSAVVADLATKTDASNAKTKMYFILPGYTELEASRSLNFASGPSVSTAAPRDWIYGHPYSQTDIPLPCPSSEGSGTPQNLGHCIPSFDDDPKNRFMDEIAYTTNVDAVQSPRRKRTKTGSSARVPSPERDEEGAPIDKKDGQPYGELSKVTPDEFWERMSFRQECVAGAVTGFFAVGITCPIPKDASISSVSTLAPQPGQVSSNFIKRIMTSLLTGNEFSTLERSARATETLESAIKGLCDGLAAIPASPTTKPVSRRGPDRPRTPEMVSRPALASPSTPPRHFARGRVPAPASPNPFPEPITSLQTYHSHIFGSISVSNPALPPRSRRGQEGAAGADGVISTPAVTVLAARKKKKKPEA